MLSRIMLRREFGREPTGDEVIDRVKQIKTGAITLPTLETITAAFENGEEVRSFPARCIRT